MPCAAGIMEIPILDKSDIVLGMAIAAGSGGTVYEGRMKAEAGWKPVAIKEVQVSVAGEEYKAELKSVATTAFLAGQNTHVCEVYGLAWGEKDCWCVCSYGEGNMQSEPSRLKAPVSSHV
jgi:hypothetical protein